MSEKWEFEAEYIQSCNCDFGCPCNFNGSPTYGNCEALVAYRVRKGTYAKVPLDGVVFALAAWWPKAIHEGNGVARYYVDSAATPEQVAAIGEITSGRHGGGVFEIFPKTFRKVYPIRQAPIEFHFDGDRSWFRVAGAGEVRSEPIRNPVTGEEFRGEVHLPNGFMWKRAAPTSIQEWWMDDEELLARHEKRSGFVSVVKMAHTGCLA